MVETSAALEGMEMPNSDFVLRHLAVIQANLRRIRGGMTQKEFARKTRVSLTTIQRIEDGQNFEIISLFKIAEALGMHPYELCMDDKELLKLEEQIGRELDRRMKSMKAEIIDELKKKA